jgi:hypothetical protein
MRRKADRPSLVGERAAHRLLDPPRGVRRKLVSEPVVELLDRADEPEVALLDEVEERHARARVAARDRHDEPQVGLDQPLLGELVPGVLAPGQLALLFARQQAAVADRSDIELQGIIELARGLRRLDISLRSEERLHRPSIGFRSRRLERSCAEVSATVGGQPLNVRNRRIQPLVP